MEKGKVGGNGWGGNGREQLCKQYIASAAMHMRSAPTRSPHLELHHV